MARYIELDALVAEIEKLIDKGKYHDDYNCVFRDGNNAALYALKERLDTLEVKEMNLDDFIKEEFNKYSCVDGYGQLSVSYNMAEFYGMIKRLTKAQKGEDDG